MLKSQQFGGSKRLSLHTAPKSWHTNVTTELLLSPGKYSYLAWFGLSRGVDSTLSPLPSRSLSLWSSGGGYVHLDCYLGAPGSAPSAITSNRCGDGRHIVEAEHLRKAGIHGTSSTDGVRGNSFYRLFGSQLRPYAFER